MHRSSQISESAFPFSLLQSSRPLVSLRKRSCLCFCRVCPCEEKRGEKVLVAHFRFLSVDTRGDLRERERGDTTLIGLLQDRRLDKQREAGITLRREETRKFA